MSIEQLKREKTRSLIMAGFELIIGILFIVLGWQFFNISNFISTGISEMGESPYTPTYIYDFYRTTQTAVLAGGFIAFVHGVKRMIDNTLNAWVKSALPTEEKQ